MAKKKFFLIIDTETTQNQKVADFGAVVVDKQGNVHARCGVLVRGVYDEPQDNPLFFDKTAPPSALWSRASADSRYERYDTMLENGTRMLASVAAINKWLVKVYLQYKPVLTAYNLAFDVDKMLRTDIDCSIFDTRFCMWYASAMRWGNTKKYLNFVLEAHAFNSPTKLGNMTLKTNAEIMTRFVLGDQNFPDEPHMALEDAEFYEAIILTKLVNCTKVSDYMNPVPYNWRKYQLKDHFNAK
jgi:hypothetical protein